MRTATDILIGREESAGRRSRTEHTEEVGGHHDAEHGARPVIGRDTQILERPGRDI